MSHFSKVFDGKVTQVIVAEPEFFAAFADPYPGEWLRTSYNTYGNVHYGQDGKPDGGVAVRGNFGAVGYTYDKVNDVFYAPQPYPSWTLNTSTWLWDPPVPYPNDGADYIWNESTLSWDPLPVPPPEA